MKTNENKTDTDNRLTQISIEMDDMAYLMSSLDRRHESATNWLHELLMSKDRPAILRATDDQLNDARDRLMDLQDTQDCLIRQRVTLRRERSHLIKIQNSDAVTFGN